MLDLERKARFDGVRVTMERVRTGESEMEEIELPSGDKVTIRQDGDAANGIRIETPCGPERTRMPFPDDLRRKAMLEKIKTASGRIRSGESDEEEVTLDEGETVRLTPDPGEPHGVAVEASQEDRSFQARAFGPSEERPPMYPADLPFLRNCAVSISVVISENGFERARNAAWMRPSDPRGALDEIKAQLREEGWEEGEAFHASTYMGHTLSSSFKKIGVNREVALMMFGEYSQVMLFEKMEE